MNTVKISCALIVLLVLGSCTPKYSALDIINETIKSIDSIETIYYKQDMSRTNPRTAIDTIFRYREMYFQRLKQDSIVGVKGHWCFYNEDKDKIVFEDIYDGQRLIRKNNLDSIVRLYDLAKHPEFRDNPFWGHNTLYGMQYTFKYILEHLNIYKIKRWNDTTIRNTDCYQITIQLSDHITMPGFATKLEESKGSISTTLFCVDKETFYPIRMKGESYSIDNPGQKFFIDQTYYDIEFNFEIRNNDLYNTSSDFFNEFEINEIKP